MQVRKLDSQHLCSYAFYFKRNESSYNKFIKKKHKRKLHSLQTDKIFMNSTPQFNIQVPFRNSCYLQYQFGEGKKKKDE